MGRPYIYQPFESPGLFRLVKLLPGTEEPLHVELHTYHLDKAPPFEVLSFAMGSSTPKSGVICGEYEFQVVPNLYHTLRSLRDARASRLLWIADLSVNQSNSEDETHLIRISQIRQTATRTLFCVTHDNIQSLKDFITYTQQLDQYRRAESHLSQAKDIFRSTSKITYQDLQEFEESVAQTQHGFDTSGVDELLQQPIFDSNGAFSNIVSSGNPVIAFVNRGKIWDEDEHTLSWTDLTNALLTYLLFDMVTIQPVSLLFVLYAQLIRRKLRDGTIRTFSDVLPPLCGFKRQVIGRSGHVSLAYELSQVFKLKGPESKPKYDYNLEEVYCCTSIHLNKWSEQPLSLSLRDGFYPDLPSWSPDWSKYVTRLLLNHPASGFFASRNIRDETESVGTENKIEEQSGEWACRGYTVDVIRRRSEDAMPPRRHCDHYAVADNAYFFTEWFEFAKQYAKKRTDDEILLEYTDTIQARGCGHVWEDPDSTAEYRVQQATKFIRFLEDPDEILSSEIKIFYAACFASHERRFAVTRDGHFCLVPATSKDGDLVCIPLGSRVPYIFRQMRGKTTLNNVGEAYVYGTMQGEGYTVDLQDEREFVLV